MAKGKKKKGKKSKKSKKKLLTAKKKSAKKSSKKADQEIGEKSQEVGQKIRQEIQGARRKNQPRRPAQEEPCQKEGGSGCRGCQACAQARTEACAPKPAAPAAPSRGCSPVRAAPAPPQLGSSKSGDHSSETFGPPSFVALVVAFGRRPRQLAGGPGAFGAGHKRAAAPAAAAFLRVRRRPAESISLSPIRFRAGPANRLRGTASHREMCRSGHIAASKFVVGMQHPPTTFL